MMEITHCANKDCEKRKECWRAMMKSGKKDVGMAEFPGGHNCKYFIEFLAPAKCSHV